MGLGLLSLHTSRRWRCSLTGVDLSASGVDGYMQTRRSWTSPSNSPVPFGPHTQMSPIASP